MRKVRSGKNKRHVLETCFTSCSFSVNKARAPLLVSTHSLGGFNHSNRIRVYILGDVYAAYSVCAISDSNNYMVLHVDNGVAVLCHAACLFSVLDPMYNGNSFWNKVILAVFFFFLYASVKPRLKLLLSRTRPAESVRHKQPIFNKNTEPDLFSWNND